MTNLEFIESLIQKVETSLVHINTWKDNKQELKVLKKDLNHLKQIKSVLVAWEVVKPNIKYEEAKNDEGIYMEYFLFLEIEEWKPEAFKIQKALEVKK